MRNYRIENEENKTSIMNAVKSAVTMIEQVSNSDVDLTSELARLKDICDDNIYNEISNVGIRIITLIYIITKSAEDKLGGEPRFGTMNFVDEVYRMVLAPEAVPEKSTCLITDVLRGCINCEIINFVNDVLDSGKHATPDQVNEIEEMAVVYAIPASSEYAAKVSSILKAERMTKYVTRVFAR